MVKILIADTYYQDYLNTLPFNPAATYDSELREVMRQSFGTFDAYSRNLAALGWETMDVIANHRSLQELWALSQPGWYCGDRLEAQIASFDPDIVFLQDLNLDVPKYKGRILAGQCSCPMPPEEKLRRMDVIFTSFPHYLDRFERMGIRAVFNPLAFDPIVLDRIKESSDGICVCGYSGINGHECSECGQLYSNPSDYLERMYDCVFIGGVGAPSHWRNGMETLEAVARAIPTFKWWGYGYSTLRHDSPLRECYQGEAWGLDYYRILLQSKICLNRHGEVAQGYSNNMRMFEATGCGALLLTERSINLSDFFGGNEAVGYGSPDEAVYCIERFLQNEPALKAVAAAGQRRTLRDHTYKQRMAKVSEVLTGMLCPA